MNNKGRLGKLQGAKGASIKVFCSIKFRRGCVAFVLYFFSVCVFFIYKSILFVLVLFLFFIFIGLYCTFLYIFFFFFFFFFFLYSFFFFFLFINKNKKREYI